jgi:hypothetical protein
MAENLDKLWRELRRHATIEKEPLKLLQLATEPEQRGLLVKPANTVELRSEVASPRHKQ